MTIAVLTWPDAIVHATWIAAGAFVIAVLIWSIFRTGQTAIRSDGRQREPMDNLRREVDELRTRLEPPIPSTETGQRR